MAAPLQVDYSLGTVVEPDWLDRIQQINAGLAWNMGLQISGTSVVLPAGTGNDVSSLVISGKMRYVEAPLTISFVGQPAGTYGIWATTGADDTVNTFTLVAVSGTGTPGGATYYRKIATVDWSGTALSNLVQLAGYRNHGFLHAASGGDPIPNGGISTAMLADGAVTGVKLPDGVVTTAKIGDQQVTADKLAPGVTGTLALADGSVTTIKLADSAVTSAKIADGTIVNADVSGSAAIARSKLDFGAGLTNSDISATAAIAKSKLAALAIVDADVANGAAIARSKLDFGSGLVNTDIGPTAAIARSKLDFGAGLVNADIAGAAAISKSKLGSLAIVDGDVSSISYAKLNLTNSIVAGDLTTGSVTNSKLGSDSVSQAKMQDASVGTAELIDASVTAVKIGSKQVTGVKLADELRNEWKVAGVWSGGPTGYLINASSSPSLLDLGYTPINAPPTPSGLTRQWRISYVGWCDVNISFVIRDAFQPSTINNNLTLTTGAFYREITGFTGDVYLATLNGTSTWTYFQISVGAPTGHLNLGGIQIAYRYV